MEEPSRMDHLQAIATSLDALIAFADRERDHVLAAKLDDARARFVALHMAPAE